MYYLYIPKCLFYEIRMKKYILLVLSVILSALLVGQSVPKKIVAKVKESNRVFCQNNKIAIPDFPYLETSLSLSNVHKLFPMVAKPATLTNKFGDTLVDISLIYELEIPTNSSLDVVCRQLFSTGWFEYVEPKNIHQVLFSPNDPNIGNQYYLNNIRAYSGWDISKGDTSIVVGISDTGFDFSHNDLIGSLAYNYNDPIDGIDNDNDGYVDNFRGWDLGTNDNNPQVVSGYHGPFVSGIVSARANNELGIAGVGFNTRVLPIKTTNADNQITAGYESIVYAATHGCAVVNCSWGGQISDGKFGEDVVNFATFNCNTLVVAACGNENNPFPFWPATYQNVLSVCASDVNDVKADLSTYGWDVDISAPGSNIYSVNANNGYTYSSGTSFAAPMVSACAAIVKSYFPNLSALQLAERLKITSDDLDTIPLNSLYIGKLGKGRLNLFRALDDLESPSIRYSNPQFSRENIRNLDTVTFFADFKNYLGTTQDLTITLSVVSGNAIMIDSVISVPILSTSQNYNNSSLPFKFVSQNLISNREVVFKLTYSDVNYNSYEYVKIYVNKSYLSIDTNQIASTLTGNGRLGFADNYFYQGNGFNYLEFNQLFYMGGLMIGKSTDQVSDNVYGVSDIDNDFTNVLAPYKISSSMLADFEAETVFNDNGAGTYKMNLSVAHNVKAWNQPNCENFIVHTFTLKNTGTTAQNGLYVGLFVDWDIYISSYNKAKYDPSKKMIYAWSPLGGKYGGIAALSSQPITRYAFDNNGNSLSLNIHDGFSGIDKYTALTSNRDSAGYNGPGTDVSTLLSYAQLNLLPGDSITLEFLLMAGNNPVELQNSVAFAMEKLHPDYSQVADINNPESTVKIAPNPASDQIAVQSNLPVEHLSIYSISGKLMHFTSAKSETGPLSVNTKSLPSGLYIVRVRTALGEENLKLIIQK